jgi:hypothetical protein
METKINKMIFLLKAPYIPVLFLFLSIFISSVSYGQILSGWDHYILNTSFHTPKQTIETNEASHDSLNTERSEVLERRRRLNAAQQRLNDHRTHLLLFFSQSLSGETDAAFTLTQPLTSRWDFTTSCFVTDRDRSYVGATHARPDLPVFFSTGRFFSGEVRYTGKMLHFRLGRLFPDYHPYLQISPYARETISGDGVEWSLKGSFWAFENRIQFLKNERFNGQAINRIFNFHRAELSYKRWSLGLGEFLLYTGINQEIDWTWSNPFISYVVHNYDTYADQEHASEFDGDTDNGLMYADLKWEGRDLQVTSRLYVDEFQVDAPDREVFTDEFLSHTQLIYTLPENRSPWMPQTLLATVSFSSAGFGYHKGLFTDFYVGEYPLLPTETGRTRYGALSAVWIGERWHLITDLWTGQYADILSLTPDKRHLREYVDHLPTETRTGLRIRAAYQPWKKLAFHIDSNISTENPIVTATIMKYFY